MPGYVCLYFMQNGSNMAIFSWFRVIFGLFLVLFPAFGHAQQALPINGQTLTFPLAKGEEKRFTFLAEKGKLYEIHAEQRGIDITVTLFSPLGRQMHVHDSPNGLFGPEKFQIKMDSAGTLGLRIVPLGEEANAPKGKFSIRIREVVDVEKDTLIQTTLSPKTMRKDLQVFRQIREKANSGFLRYRSRTQMDSLYAWAQTQVTQPLPIQEFYKIILTLTDFEGSCHNNTHLPHDLTAYLPKDNGYFPFYLRYVQGGMYVNNTGKALPLGTRIVSINGVKDADIIQALSKYSTTDGYNRTQKESFAVNYGFGWRFPFEYGFKDTYTLRYMLPETTDTLSIILNSISAAEKQENFNHLHSAPVDNIINSDAQDLYSFRMLDAQTGLLNIREFTMASNAEDPDYAVYCRFLDSVFSKLKTEKIPNLVLDIRRNPGGSNPNDLKLFTYLAKRPFRENKEAFIAFRKVPLPQYFVWDSEDPQNQKRERRYQEKEWQEEFSEKRGGKYLQNQDVNPYWQPDSNRYTGKTYVLIDENVGSAASHFAAHVRDNSDAVLVGVETVGGYYEHNGHIPVEYCLPGSGIGTRFSIVCVSQDVSEHPKQPKGHGVMPDHAVSQTLADFLANRDTQMEYVLERIRREKEEK